MHLQPLAPMFPIQIGQLFKLANNSCNTIARKRVFANYRHSYNRCQFSIVLYTVSPLFVLSNCCWIVWLFAATNRAPCSLVWTPPQRLEVSLQT